MEYGISTRTTLPFEAAIVRVTEELKREGFGVLTTIDVQATLKEKIGVAFPRYVILGACNPPLAHRALQAEEQIGLLLPCNVIVYERDGATTVAAFAPMVMMAMLDNDAVTPVAREADARLRRVIAAFAS